MRLWLVSRAPQLELLKQASVCITHAGLNTVLESLAQGVPQVAIPITFDQPGVAARLAQKRTGVVTSLDKLTPDYLSELLDEVITNSTYRANAQRLQRQIVEANGLSVAADLRRDHRGWLRKPLAVGRAVGLRRAQSSRFAESGYFHLVAPGQDTLFRCKIFLKLALMASRSSANSHAR